MLVYKKLLETVNHLKFDLVVNKLRYFQFLSSLCVSTFSWVKSLLMQL